MLRNIDINEISDGKLYKCDDLAKIGCNDCNGCSMCCHEMTDTIVLDPYDIYNLTTNLHTSFDVLIQDELTLRTVDGLIMPNINMNNEIKGCSFLNKEGRCKIHAFRPGFCRLFPLGRIYNENGFDYFIQVNECPHPNKTKVKIKKWLEIADIKKYEEFIVKWHNFQKDMQKLLSDNENETIQKQMGMAILNIFFANAYDPDIDFYTQFYERLEHFYKTIS